MRPAVGESGATLRALRDLPRVDELLAAVDPGELGREEAREQARALLTSVRSRLAGGQVVDAAELVEELRDRLHEAGRPWLRPVINATGVVLHTNLGRAPWAPDAVRAAAAVASDYCNLEIDLESGARGGRGQGVERHLRALTGAEAALVVNNCAAAVLLALSALAAGREVVVSRGELVEIGGSFRVPEVITACGARLVEVGTTNRTRLRDYEAARSERTAALLRVHPSNFRMLGFTEAPTLRELADYARSEQIPLVYDLGSGALRSTGETDGVRAAIEAGVTLVAFSADKLLGGPQAGVLVGQAAVIERLRAHPLMRALRVDKVVLAALEATLALHRRGHPTPTDEMLSTGEQALRARSEVFVRDLAALGVRATLRAQEGAVGGGAAPGQTLPGWLICVDHPSPDRAAAWLRSGEPPVVCVVRDGALGFDLRTVPLGRGEALLQRLAGLNTARQEEP